MTYWVKCRDGWFQVHSVVEHESGWLTWQIDSGPDAGTVGLSRPGSWRKDE